jgi:hypothetical protein
MLTTQYSQAYTLFGQNTCACCSKITLPLWAPILPQEAVATDHQVCPTGRVHWAILWCCQGLAAAAGWQTQQRWGRTAPPTEGGWWRPAGAAKWGHSGVWYVSFLTWLNCLHRADVKHAGRAGRQGSARPLTLGPSLIWCTQWRFHACWLQALCSNYTAFDAIPPFPIPRPRYYTTCDCCLHVTHTLFPTLTVPHQSSHSSSLRQQDPVLPGPPLIKKSSHQARHPLASLLLRAAPHLPCREHMKTSIASRPFTL